MNSKLWLGLPLAVALLGCEPARRGVEPGSHPQTGTVHVSADGARVFALSKDHQAVLVFDRASGAQVGEIAVGERPNAMTVLEDGRLAVTLEGEGVLVILDPQTQQEAGRIAVGTEPVAVVGLHNQAAVLLGAGQAVVLVDLARLEVTRSIALDTRAPSGLAVVADNTLYVSHFYDGKLSVVDVAAGRVTSQVRMHMPSNPLLFPNQLASLTVSPKGDEVSAPHQEANNDPGGFRNGSTTVTQAYYVQGPSGMPAVVPAVGTVDPRTHVATSDTDPPSATVCPGCAGQVGTTNVTRVVDPNTPRPPPAVHNVFDTATFGDLKLNGPVAVAYVDGGRGRLTLYRGTSNVVLTRANIVGDMDAVVQAWDVGEGADGLAVSPDGTHAFVYSQFDHTLHTLDIPQVDTGAELKTGLFGARAKAATTGTIRSTGQVSRATTSTQRARAVSVPFDVDAGRRLFFGAQLDSLTNKGAVSCQSCHPNGRSDGMVWTFGTARFRNTPQLGGRISDSAPFHWDGDRPDTHSMNMTIEQFMGGTGLFGQQLDQLWTFIDTIPKAPSAMAADTQMQDTILRGEALFFSPTTQCGTCHTGALLTDNQAWQVGTSDRETWVSFGTPVLAGLSASGPYFHDGREPTLDSLVQNFVKTDRMGKGSHLTDQQLSDLVAYLKSL